MGEVDEVRVADKKGRRMGEECDAKGRREEIERNRTMAAFFKPHGNGRDFYQSSGTLGEWAALLPIGGAQRGDCQTRRGN